MVDTNNNIATSNEYFSGANAKVYFGDVWVEELASIQYTISENVQPIFGFHSYTYDRVARGNRYVSGQFVINFTENGYLQTILNSLSLSSEGDEDYGYANDVSYYTNGDDSSKTISKLLKSNGGETYSDMVNSLKQSFWGDTSTGGLSQSKFEKESTSHFYPGEDNPLNRNGFNVLIDFSPDMTNSDLITCLEGNGTGVSAYNTMRTIIGVHINSMSQVLNNDGQVIQEIYSFIAKDLDGDIYQASLPVGTTYFE